MGPSLAAALGLLSAFFVVGLHVAVALGVVAFALLFFFSSRPPWEIVGFIVWNVNTDYIVVAIPLFVLMGELLLRSGLSDNLYSALSRWLNRIPGGLLHTNIATCGVFAACSGSSVATAAVVGSVAMPSFLSRNYNERLVLGSLAWGGTLGILIPPSISLILYGVLMQESIGRLYIGAFVPGILSMLSGMLLILVLATFRPSWAPREPSVSWSERLRGSVGIIPVMTLVLIVLGVIYLGVATPTEAAAFGVSGALLIALLNGRLSVKLLKDSALSAATTTAMMMLILTAAFILQFAVAVLGVPGQIARSISALNLGALELIVLLLIVYLVLGTALEPVPIIVATIPIVLPVLQAEGIDLIWFGIILLKVTEIGLISPPWGLNLFILHGMRQRLRGNDKSLPLTDVFIGVTPFILMDLVVLVLLFVFPDLVLWLPNTMRGQ